MTVDLQQGYLLRSATWSDLEPVMQLVRKQNMEDYGEPGTSTDLLKNTWLSPGFNLDADTWVIQDPDKSVVGYAELHSDGTRTRFQPSVYVDSGHRGKGLAASLLRHAEDRARIRAVIQDGIRLSCRVSERNPASRRILELAGYQLTMTFNVMEIRLSSPPMKPQWAKGISVRNFLKGEDEHNTYLVDEEASIDKGYHNPLSFDSWTRRMGLEQPYFDPTLWFLAFNEIEIVGIALNYYVPESNTGWVDHLGVRRGWRNQGVGMALLLYSFNKFYRRGVPRVKLSVDAQSLTHAQRLYERAGMHTVHQYYIYTKQEAKLSPEKMNVA